MTEWSFNNKLISGLTLVCLLAIGSALISRVTFGQLRANIDRLASGEMQDLADARALQDVGDREVADGRAALLGSGKDFSAPTRAGAVRVHDMAQTLATHVKRADDRALLARVLATEHTHAEDWARALGRTGSPDTRPQGAAIDSALASGEALHVALGALVLHLDSTSVRRIAHARSIASRAETLVVVFSFLTILLLVILCLLLIRALSGIHLRQSVAHTLAESGQTEARKSLVDAQTASRLKDEFLATVSHELRNPLAPILTWTQLLRSGTLDAEKTRHALEIIEHNVTSQTELIDDLLDLSRVVSGKFRLDVRPVDLAPLIKAVVDAQSPASDAKQIRLKLVLDERAGFISGDSERLQQVMWNLIANAIKFTPKGGRVQVVLQRAESHLEVSVSDSGVGIEPGFLPHVFEAFQQASFGSVRRHGGLGLGLSIVHHIVELHGGEISAFSDGPGCGAKFTVKFPLLATEGGRSTGYRRHPIARDSVSEAHLGRLDGIRVLIVEDEPSAREALFVLFESCGALAKVAGSVQEGLEVFETWQPDVLVSDIAMPEEDGYSLIRKIRQRPADRGGSVPAVALTAYAKIEDRISILAAGFQMYLSKPANPNELVAVIGSLARRPGPDETRIAS